MRTILSYPISILVTIGILYLLLAPPSTFDFVGENVSRLPHSDKILHFAMFFVLAAVLIYESVFRNKKIAYPSKNFLLVCIIFPIVLGGIIEILQGFLINRCACWIDWLADIAGVLVAWAIFLPLNPSPSKSPRPLSPSGLSPASPASGTLSKREGKWKREFGEEKGK